MEDYNKLLNEAIKQTIKKHGVEFCCHGVDYTLDYYSFDFDYTKLQELKECIQGKHLSLNMDWVFDLTIVKNHPYKPENELKEIEFEFVDCNSRTETFYEITEPNELAENYHIGKYCWDDNLYEDDYDDNGGESSYFTTDYGSFVGSMIDHFENYVTFVTTNEEIPYIDYCTKENFYEALESFKKVLDKYIEGDYDDLSSCNVAISEIDKLSDDIEYMSDNLY